MREKSKTKLFLSLLIVVIAVALIGGATLAWFTDSASAEDVSFQAGTLLIDAGTSMIYGVEFETGNGVYEIYIDNDSVRYNKLIESSRSGLNALAYDNSNQRLYYADGQRNLYFYDLNSGQEINADHGLTGSAVYGATFGMGYYWYVPEGTDNLRKVSLNANGTVNSDEVHHENFAGKNFGFGDLAIDMRDGVIYGSTNLDYVTEFFSYNVRTGEYSQINQGSGAAVNLQLAFGADGVLYGQETRVKEWSRVNVEAGTKEVFFTGGEDNLQFSDLACSYQDNWNPGDCDIVRFYVRNTGTKTSHVSANLTANWVSTVLDPDLVTIYPCDWEKHEDGSFSAQDSDWKPHPDVDVNNWTPDNPLYYQGILEPGQEVILCLRVCFSSEAGNEYQGETFELYPEFEAIQTTNDAPAEQWNLSWDGTEWVTQ